MVSVRRRRRRRNSSFGYGGGLNANEFNSFNSFAFKPPPYPK
jgi:hypothetical protein